MRYLLDHTDARPTVVGASGALKEGDVVTGEAAIRAIVLANTRVKITHQTPSVPGAETLAHYLWITDGAGGWTSVMSAQYGDWTYPVVGATVPYDRATVNEVSRDAVEVTFTVDSFSVASAFGGLGVRRRDDATEALDYPQSSSTAKSDTAFRFDKTIRLERHGEGYFVGYKTYPDIFPGDSHVPSFNDAPDFGEFEVGPGADIAVGFSVVEGALVAEAHHPSWGADARWAAAEAANGGAIGGRPVAYGIYDQDGTFQPSYWGLAEVSALQHAQFPLRNTTGPWALGAIRDGVNAALYMVLRHPMVVIGSQYAPSSFGQMRILYYRQKRGVDGNQYTFGTFVGAIPYTPDTTTVEGVVYGNEPTLPLQNALIQRAQRIHDRWPR